MRGAVGNALLRDSLAAGRADAIAGPGRPCSAPRWSPSARARVVSEEQPPDRFARSRSRWWVSSARAAHRSSARGSFVLRLLRAMHPLSRLRRCIAPATPLPAGLGRLWTTGSHCDWSLRVRNGRRGERERGAPSGELSRTALRLLHSSASWLRARPLPRRHSCRPVATPSGPTLSDWLPP